MNIFFLDRNPKKSAQLTNNVHIIKMITESAQLMSTAHRVLDGYKDYVLCEKTNKVKQRYFLTEPLHSVLFHACHINHPSGIWTRQSSGNYQFLYELYCAYIEEYTRRYPQAIVKGKLVDTLHKSSLLSEYLKNPPENIPQGNLIFPDETLQAMPDKYKNVDAIKAYRAYYMGEKRIDNYYIRSIEINEKGKPYYKKKLLGIPSFVFGWEETLQEVS